MILLLLIIYYFTIHTHTQHTYTHTHNIYVKLLLLVADKTPCRILSDINRIINLSYFQNTLYSHNRNYAPKSDGTQENTKGHGRYVFVPEQISFVRIHTYSRYVPKDGKSPEPVCVFWRKG